MPIYCNNFSPKLTLNTLAKYLALIRFSHSLFALPFALLSAAMAVRLNLSESPPIRPRWSDIIGILLCMVFARSAAMGFNRWADREIDAENPRTADRHIPTGEISASNALYFVIVSSIGFVLSTLIFLPNRIPFFASLPVLLFLFGYSYAKRWTIFAHFWLGAALMLAPLAAWVVVRPDLIPVPLPPVFLGLAVLFWSSGFDLIYATQDARHDQKVHLFSVPGRLGIPATFQIAACCHIIAVLLFATLPSVYEPFGCLFGVGVAAIAVILATEHWLVAPRSNRPLDLRRVNIAFFQMNVAVSLGLLGIGLLDLFF